MSILSSRKSMCKGPEIGTIFELFLKQQSVTWVAGEKMIMATNRISIMATARSPEGIA